VLKTDDREIAVDENGLFIDEYGEVIAGGEVPADMWFIREQLKEQERS